MWQKPYLLGRGVATLWLMRISAKWETTQFGKARIWSRKKQTTVNGTNPAPVDIVHIPLFVRFHTCQVVVWASSINNITIPVAFGIPYMLLENHRFLHSPRKAPTLCLKGQVLFPDVNPWEWGRWLKWITHYICCKQMYVHMIQIHVSH